MGKASWAAIESLFHRVQAQDAGLDDLRDEVVARLVHWLKRMGHWGLAPWEIAEIAEDAFSETALRISAFPSWPQAWSFTRKVALRKAIRTARRLPQSVRIVSLSGPHPVDAVDSKSSSFVAETDLRDELQALVSRLSPKKAQIIFCVVEAFLVNRLTHQVLAQRMGIAVRTLVRWLTECKGLFRHLG